jgi:hypothetical protein
VRIVTSDTEGKDSSKETAASGAKSSSFIVAGAVSAGGVLALAVGLAVWRSAKKTDLFGNVDMETRVSNSQQEAILFDEFAPF